MGDKNPKAVAKLNSHKRRAATIVPSSQGKRAATSAQDNPAYSRPIRFRFNRVDVDGPWCLTTITPEEHRALIKFMATVEEMTVSDAIPGICKREDVAGGSPNTNAQRRAHDKYPTDHERIHSLHMNGLTRVWGLLFDNEFSVIWWDPGHAVWPSTLKHT